MSPRSTASRAALGEDIPFDAFQARLLPLADAFMVMMASRPPSGSLRTTRVTLATILLGIAVVLFVGGPAIFLIVIALAQPQLILLVPGLLCLVLALGAGTVSLFGIRQRTLGRRQA